MSSASTKDGPSYESEKRDVTPSKQTIGERASTAFDHLLAWCATLGVLALVGWALLIIGLQVLGWLKHAQWQEVPAWVVLMPSEAVAAFADYQGLNPLDLTPHWPSLGAGSGIDAKGILVILRWLLSLPFSLYLFIAAGVASLTAKGLLD